MNPNYKKISFFLCILTLFCFIGTSCGSTHHAAAATTTDVNLKELTSKIESSSGKLPKMSSYSTSDKDAEDWFHYLCDFDYDKVSDYYISYSSTGSAEEIFLINLKNSKDATYAELSLRSRVKSRTATFDQYQPQEVSKLGNAIITSNKNCVALLICQDEYSAKKAFEEYFSTK